MWEIRSALEVSELLDNTVKAKVKFFTWSHSLPFIVFNFTTVVDRALVNTVPGSRT